MFNTLIDFLCLRGGSGAIECAYYMPWPVNNYEKVRLMQRVNRWIALYSFVVWPVIKSGVAAAVERSGIFNYVIGEN